MIVSINQPGYLPWLGYFDRIAASDLHIVLDHVQFEKNSFVNRNKVRMAKGWTWLTVPVETAGRFGNLSIDEVRIVNDRRWARKHWQTIEQCYAQAPYFAAYRKDFAALYQCSWERLIDLIDAISRLLLEAFAISVPLIKSSSLKPVEHKSALVLELCRHLGATTYLSGPLGRDYLDRAAFAEAGIDIAFHDYRHPTYAQAHPGFEYGMAAIDLLFMQGPGAAVTLRTTDKMKLVCTAVDGMGL